MLNQKPRGNLIPHPAMRVDREVSAHFATDNVMTTRITENNVK